MSAAITKQPRLQQSEASLRVLYIDGVGPFGGASRSLFEVVRALPSGSVDPYFVVQRGTALDFYGQLARDVVATRGLTRFDNTRATHYRGIRWLVLLRELFHLPFTLVALLRARARWRRVDLIHVNEITEIIPGLIACRLFRAPLVVHVRSMQRIDAKSLRTRWVTRRLVQDAAAVVAIDENTRSTLPEDLLVDVIQNSFNTNRARGDDVRILAKLDALRPCSLKVGFVGNLHYTKGLFDLLAAAKLLHDSGQDVEFIIVGGATRSQAGLRSWLLERAGLQQDVQALLVERIRHEGLTQVFHLLGATPDIQSVYERIDVICFPSHFDAPGRPIFEAAFSSVPSIAAVSKPRPDTLVHGETGLAIPAQNPRRLADAIQYFIDRPQEVTRMGGNARRLAEANFQPVPNARKLLAVYRRVVDNFVAGPIPHSERP